MKLLSIILFIFIAPLAINAEVKEIDNLELEKLISKGVVIIDIRRKEEWLQTGIVEGSQLSTFFDKNGKANVKNWLSDLATLVEKSDPIILICRTGRRTGLVAKFLDEKIGYNNIYNVTKGITKWIKDDNPVVIPK